MDEPKRPWWKTKRWRAAIALWLLIAYPLSLWPIAYLVGRGWVPLAPVKAAYAPLNGVKLVRVPDSAHFIMFDNPAFFQAQMKAFLAD